MSRLFETIKVRDRVLINTAFHNQRLNHARQVLFGMNEPVRLEDWVIIPGDLCMGVFKCRVVCDPDPGEIQFTPYKAPQFRTVMLVRDDNIEYPFKLTDRKCIDNHKYAVPADEVIFVKNDEITDSSIANIVFADGTAYYTPANPLLAGTQRAKLISLGIVKERVIRPGDLWKYSRYCFINAMMEFDDAKWLPVAELTWHK